MKKGLNILIVVPTRYQIDHLIPQSTCHNFQVTNSYQNYLTLPYKTFDMLAVQFSPFTGDILNHQKQHNPQLNYIHALTAGIEQYLPYLNENQILTNAKGAFSQILAEFVLLGILYFDKKVSHFLEAQKQKQWNPILVNKTQGKKVLIIGYGDIGQQVGKLLKCLNMEVVGVRNSFEGIQDGIRVVKDYEHELQTSDFVIGILPSTKKTKYYFNEAFFKKMKRSSIFINIGRGNTVIEQDLIQVLEEKLIQGAVLDVFEQEPLTKNSELWNQDNVLIYPHCADQDHEFLDRSFKIFLQNVNNFYKGLPLINICDKVKGY